MKELSYNTGFERIIFTVGDEGLEFNPKDAGKMASEWLLSAIMDEDKVFLECFKDTFNNHYEGTNSEDWEQFIQYLEKFSDKVRNDSKLFNMWYKSHVYHGQYLCKEYKDKDVSMLFYTDLEVRKQRQDYAKHLIRIIEENFLYYDGVDCWEDLLIENGLI